MRATGKCRFSGNAGSLARNTNVLPGIYKGKIASIYRNTQLFPGLCLVRVQLRTLGCFIYACVLPAFAGAGSPFMQRAIVEIVVFCNPRFSRKPGSSLFSSGREIC